MVQGTHLSCFCARQNANEETSELQGTVSMKECAQKQQPEAGAVKEIAWKQKKAAA